MRALPVAVTLMDQARAWKHGTDLGNRLADPAFHLLGRDAVVTVIGLQNAGKRPACGTPAREQIIDLAGAGDAGFGGGGIVIWLPGRVLTGGRAAAIEGTGAASQIPADCNPEVYDEGFWSRVDAWVGQLGPYRTRRHCAGI